LGLHEYPRRKKRGKIRGLKRKHAAEMKRTKGNSTKLPDFQKSVVGERYNKGKSFGEEREKSRVLPQCGDARTGEHTRR